MNSNTSDLIERMHRQMMEQMPSQLLPPDTAPTIHFTELPPATPGNPVAAEWNYYRREAGRLLAEGNEGRWVLIKDEQLLGIWDTQDEAMAEGYRRFFRQPFLVHQIQEWERLLRPGYHQRCN